MKILHINVNYKTNVLHKSMILHMNNIGLQNDVIVPVSFSDNFTCEENNVTVLKCFGKFDRINYYKKQKKIYSALVKSVIDMNYDCIHAYTVFTDGNIAYQLHKNFKIPYVVAVRNTDVNTFFKYMPHLRKRGVEILRNASAIFFLSEKYKERTFKNYIPENLMKEIESKTYVIPNGIDPFWLKQPLVEKSNQNSDIKVVCAGAVDKNKNMLALAKALAKIEKKDKNVQLNIAGGVKNKKIFSRLLKYSFVKYHGKLSKQQLCELYENSDVFALASFHETFGMVYIEAMSRGLPVIYTRNEGFDGQFPEGSVGLSVNPYNVNEIAEKILELFNRRESMKKECISGVERYNWETLVERYKQIYECCLRG